MQRKTVPESAILTISMRWSDRLLGIVSMVILARLLVPADFGIIVMASLVVGLVDVILDIGVSTALIHNKNVDDEDYNTAWTLRFIQSCLVGFIIYLSAPFAADFYNNILVADVLRVMSLSVIIGGLENIGIVSFQKNMEFGKDFKFFFYKRITGFFITLIFAFILVSYWAMVIGALSSRIIGVLLSYQMHPYRPRFQLSRLSAIWSFSKWVLLRNIGLYIESQTDKLLVGNRASDSMLGIYSVAHNIAAMPTTELLAPLGRVLFPNFVQKRDDPSLFAQSLITAIGIQALIAIPACIGMALVADDAVLILLGPGWALAAPLIQIMALTNLVISLAHSTGYALLATGKVKLLALVTWLQAIIFLTLAILFFPHAGVVEIASIRMLAVIIGSAFLISIALFQVKVFHLNDFFMQILRPSIASGAMVLLLLQLHAELIDLAPVVRILIEVVSGCAAYIICLGGLWLLQGRPEGAESYLIKNIKYKFQN